MLNLFYFYKKELVYKKLSFAELKDPEKHIHESYILINTPLISHLFIPSFLIAAISWPLISGQASFYIFPLVTILVFLLYQLWKLFDPINIIKINRVDQCFLITPRNQIKRLFIGNIKIPFAEIIKFELSEGPEINLAYVRFIISAVRKSSYTIHFTQIVENKELAKDILKFLNQAIDSTNKPVAH